MHFEDLYKKNYPINSINFNKKLNWFFDIKYIIFRKLSKKIIEKQAIQLSTEYKILIEKEKREKNYKYKIIKTKKFKKNSFSKK